jgi:predicted transcriptional regulator
VKETEKHERAFETYYAQGAKRSLAKVAAELGVSRSAVKSWSKAFRWAARVGERDRAVARVVADRSVKAEVDATLRNRQIVQMALVQIARQVAEGTVRATISDLDRLVRLEAFLEGKADSRQEVIARDLAGKSTDELRVMLRDEIAELAELTQEEGTEPH